jgi:hypothetical protein
VSDNGTRYPPDVTAAHVALDMPADVPSIDDFDAAFALPSADAAVNYMTGNPWPMNVVGVIPAGTDVDPDDMIGTEGE